MTGLDRDGDSAYARSHEAFRTARPGPEFPLGYPPSDQRDAATPGHGAEAVCGIQLHRRERLIRRGPGLQGVAGMPLRVWNRWKRRGGDTTCWEQAEPGNLGP